MKMNPIAQSRLLVVLALLCCALAQASETLLYEKKSEYNNIIVTEDQDGYRVLRFTWWDVTRRPAVVADRVRRLLSAAA